MIDIKSLKPSNIGDKVVFEHRPGDVEHGTITSWNDQFIFVNFPKKDSSGRGCACKPEDLYQEMLYDLFLKPEPLSFIDISGSLHDFMEDKGRDSLKFAVKASYKDLSME